MSYHISFPASSGAAPGAPSPADPDRPGWGVGQGVAVWMASVSLLFVTVFAAQATWFLVRYAQTGAQPSASDLASPSLALCGVLGTLVAHGLTIFVCVAVVRKTSRFGFFDALGWGWPRGFRWPHALGLVLLFYPLGGILERMIPQSETDLDKLLKYGLAVRVAVAILASLTAPFVEEIVYRGVLFGALRKEFGAKATVAVVSGLFLLVHVPQYWGGWAGLTLLALLSVTLTVVRAATGSVLPGFFMHFVFNGVQAVGIVFFWDYVR
jgi:hypothetical protein